MNIHKKLVELGFKKIEPHKLEYDKLRGKSFIKYKELKIDAPKWIFTYHFQFSKETKVWAIVEKHTEITIYVESATPVDRKTLSIKNRLYYGDYINRVYTNIGGSFPPLEGIGNIIQFLPKEVKRDLIISKLFK